MNFRHSIFFKFSMAFLVMGLIPLLVLSMLSLNQFTGQIERHTTNNIKQILLFMSKNINDIFTGYDEISKMMYYNSDPSMIFMDSEPGSQQPMQGIGINQSAMDDFLKNVLFSDPHIQNVLFVRSSDNSVSQQNRGNKPMSPLETFPLIGWDYPLRTNPKKMTVFPYHLENYYTSQDRVMTFARNWIDTSQGARSQVQSLGTLYFDIDVDVFDTLLEKAKLGSHDEIYVINENDSILYSNRRDRMGERFDEILVKGRGDMIVYSEPIPFINGKVVGLISRDELYAPISRTQTSVLVAVVFSTAVLIIMGIWFSRMFTNPIVQMMRHMVKVESGNLNTVIHVRHKDEMGRLAHGFNRMVERLKIFINDAYVNEIKRKQAELNALKGQIRPHYLYNTLEVIRMSAFANGDRQVADMIHALSGQLQYVIDYGEEWVTLRRELEHLRNYFHLIEVRFDNRIELQLELKDEKLLDAPILKLTLQPLVENAVHHGIRPKGGKGKVFIVFEEIQEQMLEITVYDDGIGMDETALQELNDHLAKSEGAAGKSIGVKNVHERIKAACGEMYGLDIESKPYIGTSVRILLPLNMEVEHEKNPDDIS
ncbi:sensor histidine kinase [Paenibacillus sp. WST5]|uniref:histidine kinase n=1 Tax=Paenibacillus sedimenti TaxID=2770274 RepID=A0A926QM19_9BACL|nr:sensor histidine kinase [Paenibacillus sedimenti]